MQHLHGRGKPYLVFGKNKPGQLQIWLRLFNESSASSTIFTAFGCLFFAGCSPLYVALHNQCYVCMDRVVLMMLSKYRRVARSPFCVHNMVPLLHCLPLVSRAFLLQPQVPWISDANKGHRFSANGNSL
jgi:hypothetical protein